MRRFDRSFGAVVAVAILLGGSARGQAPAAPHEDDNALGAQAGVLHERQTRLATDAFAAVAGAAVVTFGASFAAVTAYSAAETLAADGDVPWMLFGIGGVALGVGVVTLVGAGLDAALVAALSLSGPRPLTFGKPAPPPLSTVFDPARQDRVDDGEIKRWVLMTLGLASGAAAATAGGTMLFVVLGTESLGESGPAQTAVAAFGTMSLAVGVLCAGGGILAPLMLRSEDDIVQAVLDERAPPTPDAVKPPGDPTAPAAE